MKKFDFESEQPRSVFARKSFYVALAVCLVAVGAAAWTALGAFGGSSGDGNLFLQSAQSDNGSALGAGALVSGIPRDSTSAVQPDDGIISVTSAPSSVISNAAAPASSMAPVSSAPAASSSASSASSASSTVPASSASSAASSSAASTQKSATSSTSSASIFYVLPVKGQINVKFSDTELQYSQTFKDWRLHLGMDIAAAQGSDVVACADGTVTDIYSDDTWGTTIVIDHGSGIQSYYSSIDNPAVKVGAPVSANTLIGYVGTVPCESSDPSHIHFAMKKNGQWVDPLEIMAMQAVTDTESTDSH